MKNLIVSSVLSTLIGFALPYFVKYLICFFKRMKKDNLCGTWYSYSLVTENNLPKIYEGTVIISKGILSLYESRIYENGLKYKGTVCIENNHLLMIHKTNIESRSETSCVRLDYSSYHSQDKLHGYWLSYDSDNYISCGTIILSKSKIASQKVLQEMELVSHNYKSCLLRMR